MSFYLKGLLDGSECWQVAGYYEPMTKEEAAGKNRRAIKYVYIEAKCRPLTVSKCDGTSQTYFGGISHYLHEYRESIRNGRRRGMQLLSSSEIMKEAA